MDASATRAVAQVPALLAEFWACVDRIVDRPAAAFFTDDGEMALGFGAFHGVDAITDYFRQRSLVEREQGRFTRHVLTNVWIEAVENTGCDVRSVVTVHAGIGKVPLPSHVAAVIADFQYRLVDTASGWRIAALRASPVFLGNGSLATAAPNTAPSV